ncbi:hypothetical protein [Kribbella sp. VKM Ac-2568]|uniref:hypothetical protein n=1 Tax=Kribbella sp. VKM Ac-2568 TaxID=2512219 RepID=UPI00105260BD|nr:hypothetical protein [Kribbella sp. VKM Ac-2568]TCM51486.1 hypothetical protein EV648_101323 [Kribbella sp. VKM Ac-2568]
MTAQHTSSDDQFDPQAVETDPLGPIDVPTRSRLGRRAMALAGVVGVASVGVAALTETFSTWPTIAE